MLDSKAQVPTGILQVLHKRQICELLLDGIIGVAPHDLSRDGPRHACGLKPFAQHRPVRLLGFFGGPGRHLIRSRTGDCCGRFRFALNVNPIPLRMREP